MTAKFSESDMYAPIKNFFTGLGYAINAEVKNCDITLLKDGKLIVIELKKTFCLPLLFQALERQKLADEVYVAVPRFKSARGAKYNDIINIVRRLGLGLITIAMDSPVKTVDILVFPQMPTDAKKNTAKKARVINEISQRTFDLNEGGSVKKKLITAYREKVIKIACVLEKIGPLKACELVNNYGCDKNAYTILRANAYGWFERMENARFGLGKIGLSELNNGDFKQLVDYYKAALEQ